MCRRSSGGPAGASFSPPPQPPQAAPGPSRSPPHPSTPLPSPQPGPRPRQAWPPGLRELRAWQGAARQKCQQAQAGSSRPGERSWGGETRAPLLRSAGPARLQGERGTCSNLPPLYKQPLAQIHAAGGGGAAVPKFAWRSGVLRSVSLSSPWAPGRPRVPGGPSPGVHRGRGAWLSSEALPDLLLQSSCPVPRGRGRGGHCAGSGCRTC